MAAVLGLSGCPGDDGPSNDTEGSTGTTGTSTSPSTGPGVTTDPETTTGADTTEGETTSDETTMGTTAGDPTLLERMLEAVGGQDQIDALASAEFQATGNRGLVNEGLNPGDPAVTASTFTTTVALDFSDYQVRNDITRDILFVSLPMPLQITEQATVGGGYVSGVESIFGFPTGNMLSDRFASTLKQAILLNPHYLLKELSADSSGAVEAGTADFDGQTYDLLEIEDDIFPITLWVDQRTDLIVRLTTMENTHLHRDTMLEVTYDDWQDAGDGVLFPQQVQLLLDGQLIHDETRSDVQANAELPKDTFVLPPEANPMLNESEFDRGLVNHQHNQIFASIGIPIDGLQPFITSTELVPGVHHITGGTHHSMVIEQQNGLVVIEAPLNAQRCESILSWIDMNFGGAPVTHVVLSHHHEDHSACARTFVATGATLVVHEAAETFFDDVLARPSTIEPDRLENTPIMDPIIEVVPTGGSFVLDDPFNPVEIYELVNTHAADMVFPFMPNAGVAFTADIYSPGNPSLFPTGPQEVLDAFDTHGVRMMVNTIAGAHGGTAPLAELEMLAGG